MAPPRNEADGLTRRDKTAGAAAGADAQAVPQKQKQQFTPIYDDGVVSFGPGSSLIYYMPYAFVLLPMYLFANPWASVWIVFALVPLLDFVLPKDDRNPTEEQRKEHEEDWAFKLPLLLWLPLAVFTLARALAKVSVGEVAGPAEALGHVVSTALVTAGIGINVAHELLHKRSAVERFSAHALLSLTSYNMFFIEHVAGHHKTVATPEDPASAVRGQNLFAFAARSMVLSHRSAWRHETRRVGGAWTPRNRMLWMTAGPFVLGSAVYHFYGGAACAFFFAQGLLGAFLLEDVNYIEHWGLRRAQLPDGRYERVNPTHSWNASNTFTNWLLFKLQRHSDHHANATRRYHMLRTFEESPQMPTGYAGMVVVALFPWVFDSIMGDALDAYHAAKNKRDVDYGSASRKTGLFLLAWSTTLTWLAWSVFGLFRW